MKLLFTTLLLLLSTSFAYNQTLWSRAKVNSDDGAKYGIVLSDGSWLIEPKYDNIKTFSYANYRAKFYFMVEENEKFGLLDSTGKTILPTSFDIIRLSNQFISVRLNGKTGAYSFSGNKILDAKFEQVFSCCNERFPNYVRIDPQGEFIGFGTEGHFGLVDTSGNVLIPPNYDYITQKSGFYSVRKNDILSLYSRAGVQLNITRYTDFEGHHSQISPRNYIKAKSNGKWGVIDSVGNVVVQPVYSDLFLNKTFIHVTLNNKKGIALYTGEMILDPIYDDIFINKEKKFFCYQLNGKYGLSTISGKSVLPTEYDDIRTSRYHIEIEKNGKYGICNKDGEIILEAKYEMINHESGSPIIIYKDNGKLGAVSIDKKEITTAKYDELRVNNNWIIAKLNGKISGYSFTGDLIFESADNIRCIDELFFYLKNDRWGAANIEGEEIIPSVYSDIGYSSSNGPIPVKKNNKWGYISIEGKTIIPFIYDEALDLLKSSAPVTKDGKSFYINHKNELHQIDKNPTVSRENHYPDEYGPVVDFGRDRLAGLPKFELFWLNGNVGLKDNDKIVLPSEYSKIILTQHPIFLAQKDELWGTFDLAGTPILERKYSELTPFLQFRENANGNRERECAVYSNQSKEPTFITSSKELKASWLFYEPLYEKEVKHNGYYSNVNQAPYYPGGYGAMNDFIESEMKFSRKANKISTITTVYAKCIIELDGQVSSIEVIDPTIPSYFSKEAKRILQAMPIWQAAVHKGIDVRYQITIQMIFDPANFKNSK